MIFYISSWFVLITGAWLVGDGVLRFTAISCLDHEGDRLIVSIWLGLLTISVCLLFLSVILPLSPVAGSVLAAILMLVFARGRLWKNARISLHRLRLTVLLGSIVLAVSCALNATRSVETYDTGLYHYQLTNWLGHYGTVPGLALIHFRFGFTSSWFALAAPFDFGVFQGRVSGLLGGIALFLCLVHFALAFGRIVERRDTRADWFLVSGYPLIILFCLAWSFEVSLSPDLPVWILTFLVAWLFLISMEPTSSSPTSNLSPRHNPILPLLMAFAAITVKLSAAPVVAVAALFFCMNSNLKWRTRLLLGLLASLAVVPLLLANVISSGCPLYPAPLFCLDFPWGMGKIAAKIVTEGTGNWARWGGEVPEGAGTWDWMLPWISHVDKLVLLSFCVLCLAGFLTVRGWRKSNAFLWVLALAISGTFFVFATAPNPRFAAGYLALFPAVFLSAVGPDIRSLVHWNMITRPSLARSASFVCLLALGALIVLQDGMNESRLRQKLDAFGISNTRRDYYSWPRILLPPRLPHFQGDVMIVKNRRSDKVMNLELINERANAFEYQRPLNGDQCWGASLPCVPWTLPSDVNLRRPTEGFSAGFIRSANIALGR